PSSWPNSVEPQQYSAPAASPHACAPPVTSADHARPPATSVGVVAIVAVPGPSWPNRSSPPHASAPPASPPAGSPAQSPSAAAQRPREIESPAVVARVLEIAVVADRGRVDAGAALLPLLRGRPPAVAEPAGRGPAPAPQLAGAAQRAAVPLGRRQRGPAGQIG